MEKHIKENQVVVSNFHPTANLFRNLSRINIDEKLEKARKTKNEKLRKEALEEWREVVLYTNELKPKNSLKQLQNKIKTRHPRLYTLLVEQNIW